MRRAFIAALLSAVVAGCPAPTSEVVHEVELVQPPDVACIEAILRIHASGGKIEVGADESTPWKNYGFMFNVSAVPHHLGIQVRPDGTSRFHHASWAPKLKLRELQDAERSLTDIELQLTGHCNLGELAQGMRQACYGKHCDRLRAAT